jgi:hypothetical protein
MTNPCPYAIISHNRSRNSLGRHLRVYLHVIKNLYSMRARKITKVKFVQIKKNFGSMNETKKYVHFE